MLQCHECENACISSFCFSLLNVYDILLCAISLSFLLVQFCLHGAPPSVPNGQSVRAGGVPVAGKQLLFYWSIKTKD
jgi:hypothetical protein